MTKKIATVTVKQTDEPIAVDVIAEAIISISKGVKVLTGSRLKRGALVLLIQHASPTLNGRSITRREVEAVLDGIESLEKQYLKP